MGHPVVSVIIPVFNTRPYLQQCLDSLTGQTLPEMEIICVDNGSSDGSYEFLQDYAERHANMTVLRHPQGRQGGARNAGIEKATGEYIGFVDSDDFIAPTMLERMVETAQVEQADVVVCNIKLYYESTGWNRKALPDDLLVEDGAFSIQQRPRLLRNLTICNKLFSRELIERNHIRFPEGSFHEDQFFVIAAFLLAQRIMSVPEALYFYRRERPGSVNEYRGVDHLQIFRVMEMVNAFVAGRWLQDSYQDLMDELAISRILLVAHLIGCKHRHPYFRRMRGEFRKMKLPKQPKLLTATEFREFQIVRRFGYVRYSFFLVLRQFYGRLLALNAMRKTIK